MRELAAMLSYIKPFADLYEKSLFAANKRYGSTYVAMDTENVQEARKMSDEEVHKSLLKVYGDNFQEFNFIYRMFCHIEEITIQSELMLRCMGSRKFWKGNGMDELYGAIIPKVEKVIEYLEEHPKMAPLVKKACKALSEKFSKETQISVEIYDFDAGDRHISINVRQSKYDDDVMDKIDEALDFFDNELCEASEFMHIGTDFEPPLKEM